MEISEPKEVTRYGFTPQILHIKEQMCAAFRLFTGFQKIPPKDGAHPEAWGRIDL